jgi:hypothetical protein
VPRTFSGWVTKVATTDRVKGPRSGVARHRSVDGWDVEGRADGVVWAKRFRRAGLAQLGKERLDADYVAGLPFDLRTKPFVVPEAPAGLRQLSVFDLTELYFRQHPEWEPATKEAAARSFSRARRWLLAPGVDPRGDELVAVRDFLEHASFLPAHLEAQVTDGQRAGRAWLEAHSAAADSLASAQIEAFVARFEVSERNPAKRVSASSVIRFLQPLKACWTWAVARDELPVDRNPWGVVKPRRKVKGQVHDGDRSGDPGRGCRHGARCIAVAGVGRGVCDRRRLGWDRGVFRFGHGVLRSQAGRSGRAAMGGRGLSRRGWLGMAGSPAEPPTHPGSMVGS